MTSTELRDRHFEQAKKALLPKIHSWEDWYSWVQEHMRKAVQDTPIAPLVATDTLVMLFAFNTAMMRMPEEGDIAVLVEEAIRYLVYEMDIDLGTDISAVSSTLLDQAVAGPGTGSLH